LTPRFCALNRIVTTAKLKLYAILLATLCMSSLKATTSSAIFIKRWLQPISSRSSSHGQQAKKETDHVNSTRSAFFVALCSASYGWFEFVADPRDRTVRKQSGPAMGARCRQDAYAR